jgi:Mn-containing catalase
MFFHHKKLMYTVRVRESNPQLASLMLEQFGGPQGELRPQCVTSPRDSVNAIQAARTC